MRASAADAAGEVGADAKHGACDRLGGPTPPPRAGRRRCSAASLPACRGRAAGTRRSRGRTGPDRARSREGLVRAVFRERTHRLDLLLEQVDQARVLGEQALQDVHAEPDVAGFVALDQTDAAVERGQLARAFEDLVVDRIARFRAHALDVEVVQHDGAQERLRAVVLEQRAHRRGQPRREHVAVEVGVGDVDPEPAGQRLDQPGLEELDVAGLLVHLRGDVHLVFQPAVLAEAELERREFVGHAALADPEAGDQPDQQVPLVGGERHPVGPLPREVDVGGVPGALV